MTRRRASRLALATFAVTSIAAFGLELAIAPERDNAWADPPSAPTARGGIEGIVVFEGKPVAGATVTLRKGVPLPRSTDDREQVERGLALLDDSLRDDAPVATTTTDDRGRFAFRDLARSVYALEASAAPSAGAKGPFVGFAMPVEVEASRWSFAGISLYASRGLSGHVVDGDGRPFRGSVLLSLAEKGGAEHPHAILRRAAVGDDGGFSFAGLPSASYELTAAQPGFRILARVSPLPPDGTSPLWALPKCAPRAFRVSVGGRRPIANARVIAESVEVAGMQILAGGRTGADGVASLVVPVGAAGIVRVVAPGIDAFSMRYEAQFEGSAGGADSAMVVNASPTPSMALGRISGRVLDEDGKPVAGAAVHVHQGNAAFMVAAAPVWAVSGADGHFVLEDVASGPLWLSALGQGFSSRRTTDAAEPPRRSEIVVLPAGGAIEANVPVLGAAQVTGTVVSSDGKPLAGVLLSWQSAGETLRSDSDWAPPIERSVASAADGRFVIRSVSPRTSVVVRASAAGFVEREIGVAVPESGGVADANFVLDASRIVTVRVVDVATRMPIEGASVAALRPAAVTGLDGVAILCGLPRGPVGLVVAHPEFQGRAEAVAPESGDAALTVTMSRGLEITGWVRDAAGRPVAGASVSAEPATRPGVVSDATGRFRLVGLAPGPRRIHVLESGRSAEAVVAAGASDVVLVLRGEAVEPVVVTAIGADGKPIPRAQIAWNSPNESGEALIVDGKATIEAFGESAPQGWTISVSAPTDLSGRSLPFRPARVGPLGPRDRAVRVVLPGGRSVSGRVVTPTGDGVADVGVFAFLPLRGSAPAVDALARFLVGQTRTDAIGGFSIDSVADGDVLLTTKSTDPTSPWGQTMPVRVAAGDSETITLSPRVASSIEVLDREGKPLAGAFVVAERDALGEPEHHRSRADERGRAVLDGLVLGARYELSVEVEAGAGVVPIERRRRWMPGDDVVRIGGGEGVHGTVRDREGRPVEGAIVARAAMRVVPWSREFVLSGAGGFYRFPADAESPVTLVARPTSPVATTFHEDELASAPEHAEAGDRVDFVVNRGVAMTVAPSADDAISWRDAIFWLTRERPPDRSADGEVEPDTQRQRRLPPLVAGASYRLWIPAPVGEPCALEPFVAVEGGVVAPRVVTAVAVTGTVKAPDGFSFVDVRAQGDGYFVRGVLERDGAFALGGVPPGLPVAVTVIGRVGMDPWNGTATAMPGTPVTIELQPMKK